MKKLSVGLVAVFMFLAIFSVACFAEGGQLQKDGDVYCIYSSDDFVTLSKMVSDGFDFTSSEIKLMNDVCIDSSKFWDIGTEKHPFNGVFNGNGYTVTCSERRWSLFGYIGPEGVVADLTLGEAKSAGNDPTRFAMAYRNKGMIRNCCVNILVDSDICYTHCVVDLNDGKIIGCTINSTIRSGRANVAGIVDCNRGEIDGCSVNGSIESVFSRHSAAGVAISNSGKINNCTVRGSVSSMFGDAVGLVLENSGIITGCTVSGSVDSDNCAAGIAKNNRYVVSGCIVSGKIDGDNRVAGVALENVARIYNCTVKGLVRSKIGIAAGIAIDNKHKIEHCCVYNTVTGKSGKGKHSAGLVYHNFYSSVVYDCQVSRKCCRNVDSNYVYKNDGFCEKCGKFFKTPW